MNQRVMDRSELPNELWLPMVVAAVVDPGWNSGLGLEKNKSPRSLTV